MQKRTHITRTFQYVRIDRKKASLFFNILGALDEKYDKLVICKHGHDPEYGIFFNTDLFEDDTTFEEFERIARMFNTHSEKGRIDYYVARYQLEKEA